MPCGQAFEPVRRDGGERTIGHESGACVNNTGLWYFTSITAHYLAKARIMAKTLKLHNPDAAVMLVVSGDLPEGFRRENEPFDDVLLTEDLDLPDKKGFFFKHNVTELCTAVKAAAALKIMELHRADKVVYLDPDIAVFDSLAPLAEWLDQTSILLIPHQTVPEEDHRFIIGNEVLFLKRGTFNLGFFGVRNDETGRRFLSWWNSRLMHYCADDNDEHLPLQQESRTLGLFTDQKWVDLVPSFFDRYLIIKDPGYNVATWNLSRHALERSAEGKYLVDGHPLRFFHFSGVDSGAHAVVLDLVVDYNPKARAALEVSSWYRNELAGSEDGVFLKLPGKYARYSDGKPIPSLHRRVYLVRRDVQHHFPDPFLVDRDSCYRDWVLHEYAPARVARRKRIARWLTALRGLPFFARAQNSRWLRAVYMSVRRLVRPE